MSAHEVKSAADKLATSTKSGIIEDGEIPAIVVYPDRCHVDYINNIVDPVTEVLKRRNFHVYKLSSDTPADDHFGRTFESLASECVLGIVVLDGFRPNVIYEYGYLRGLKKLVIPIQDRDAKVAVKSFYQLKDGSSSDSIRVKCGLSKRQFEQLREPSIGYFRDLSDRHGIKVRVVDHNASVTSEDHPTIVVQEEVSRLLPDIISVYKNHWLVESIQQDSPDTSQISDLANRLLGYVIGESLFDVTDIDALGEDVRRWKQETGEPVPPVVYSLFGRLYENLAHKERGRQ